MSTEQKVKALTLAEESAYAVYLEAHQKANEARKELAHAQLKQRGIELNKTQVFVTDFNGEDTRAVVREINKSGKAICFPVDVQGRQQRGQSTCCFVHDIRSGPA